MTSIIKNVQVFSDPDGSTRTVLDLSPTAINWPALLQAIISAMPAILAIIAAFTGQPPVPKPVGTGTAPAKE